MRNRVRFFVKKRGSRRTGSQQTGSIGLALFMAVLFAGGWALALFMVRTQIVPEWRANRHFRPSTCTVLGKRLGENQHEGTKLFRPEIHIRYEVDEQPHETWTYNMSQVQGNGYSSGQEYQQAILDRFTIGQQYPCWYDPDNHDVAVVFRSRAWVAWSMLVLPVSFIIIGGSGLGYAWVNWGTSTERRAAMTQQAEQAVQLDRFDPSVVAAVEYPFVPAETDMNNSPGVKLAYRLPVRGSTVGAMVALVSGTVLWNLVGMVFLLIAINGFRHGEREWFLALFLLPYLTAGGWLVRYTFRRMSAYVGLGTTLLEISDHPLYPGRNYQINLSQSGWLDVHTLQIKLVCEERATFQQGTNTRTDYRRVHEQTILSAQDLMIRPESLYEVDSPLEVPAQAMHSFKGRHNEVSWRLAVRGEILGRPGFEREFPLVVRPAPDGSAAA